MRRRSLYSVHPGLSMEKAAIANLHKRTGRTLEQWVEIVKKTGPPTEKERRKWLKTQHGITTNYAWWIAERAEGKGGVDNYDPDALVDAMFSGRKSALRPVYDRLLSLCLRLGKDVKACPGKTIVPLYRKHVFAQIKPSTQTRIDLGFALKNTMAKGRLIETGGLAKGDRITHRIPIARLSDIDEEVKRWLRAAYESDK